MEIANGSQKKKNNFEIVGTGDHAFGICVVFKHKGKEYYASLAKPPHIGIECMIFNSKNGHVTDWDGVAVYYPHEVSEEKLIECIEVFCGVGD